MMPIGVINRRDKALCIYRVVDADEGRAQRIHLERGVERCLVRIAGILTDKCLIHIEREPHDNLDADGGEQVLMDASPVILQAPVFFFSFIFFC